MNNTRRKEIEKAKETIETISLDLEAIRDEEQEYADNMPESLQNSEKHDNAENTISDLDDAINNCSEIANSLEQSVSY